MAGTSKRLQTGSELGAYRLESLLGAGGMGEVYRAKDVRLGRWVAIKVLLPQVSADVEARRRFEGEARAIANLNHPNICTLHDIGSEDGVDYIVMEYLEGDTLAGFLATRRLPMDRVLDHGMAISSALAAAHRQCIVHRDLKPGNIILTRSGVKVLDFGLAKFLDAGAVVPDDETMAAQPMVLGTPAYMAPEQRAGKECDARTDIYALGLVLAEMATGRRRMSVYEPLPRTCHHSLSSSNAASHRTPTIGGNRALMFAWHSNAWPSRRHSFTVQRPGHPSYRSYG